MPSFSSTYLLPAIILNPAFILHLINTFVSHWVPPPPTVSHSPHPFMESLGPVPGSILYLDMHADEQLCWGYTVVMVIIQVLAFGRVSDNRVRRKSAKAAKIEREKIRREKLEKLQAERMHIASQTNGHADALDGLRDLPQKNGNINGAVNGLQTPNGKLDAKLVPESEETLEKYLRNPSPPSVADVVAGVVKVSKRLT
ncbi:hypothetical protein G7Y89_g5917 [Cudoniella acicularis]|uniref:Uncharacterized protein n=1 Tax=Cudoniella acicularis TaxID=354080 RepID=A0A8H4RNW7_9HELO|nr:hypothetical protein G7Y89_g5917 [Cudoniella acicularis]